MNRIKAFFSKMKNWAGDHPALAGISVGVVVVGLYWLVAGRKRKAGSAAQPATLAGFSPGVSGSGGGTSGSGGSGDTGQAIDPNTIQMMDGIRKLYDMMGDLTKTLQQPQQAVQTASPVVQPDVTYPPAAAVPAGGGMNVPALVYDMFSREEMANVVRGDFDLQRGGGLDSHMSVFTNDLSWASKIEADPYSSVVPMSPGSKFVMAFKDPVSAEKYAQDRAKVSAITGKSGSIASQLSAPSDNGGASDQAKLQTLIQAGLARSGDDPIWK